MSGFKTFGDMRKYFEDVERRFEDGSLIPTSEDGEADRDRLILAVNDTALAVADEYKAAQAGNHASMDMLLDLVDLRARLILLLGKFEGFRYGQKFVVDRAGHYSEFLM